MRLKLVALVQRLLGIKSKIYSSLTTLVYQYYDMHLSGIATSPCKCQMTFVLSVHLVWWSHIVAVWSCPNHQVATSSSQPSPVFTCSNCLIGPPTWTLKIWQPVKHDPFWQGYAPSNSIVQDRNLHSMCERLQVVLVDRTKKRCHQLCLKRRLAKWRIFSNDKLPGMDGVLHCSYLKYSLKTWIMPADGLVSSISIRSFVHNSLKFLPPCNLLKR